MKSSLELNSSGTSGNKSRIFLDKRNAIDQKNIFRKFYNKNLVKKDFLFDTRSKPNPY